ncbi:MAG: 50S ribosomal protein L11 methyltransferase, partial [Bacteroidota bacterium]
MGQLRYAFEIEEAKHDLLTALLSGLPFYAFESEEYQFFAYLHEKDWSADLENVLANLDFLKDHNYQKETLPYQNWNEVWESNFQPIKVDDFCYIRAPFHQEDTTVRYQILINPEMAFGTGHHATTFMMIQLMSKIVFKRTKVLDYGCGTG